jgi:hypothetical protein
MTTFFTFVWTVFHYLLLGAVYAVYWLSGALKQIL